MLSRYTIVCFFLGLGFILVECEPSEVGCLDKRASNYNVVAVSGCDDCCEYPAARLNVNFVFDTLDNFSFNTLYPLGDNDSVSIATFKLAFSEFDFYEDGNPLTIIDTVNFVSPQLKDDFLIVNQSSTRKTIGHTDYIAVLDSISCRIGLDVAKINALGPREDIDLESQLSAVASDLYSDSLAVINQAYMELTIDDSLRSLFIPEIIDFDLTLVQEIELMQGEAWDIELTIDVFKLVQGISAIQSNELMVTTIKENIRTSIF